MVLPFLLLLLMSASLTAHGDVPDKHWPVMQEAFFSGHDVQEGTGMIRIEAPERAEDAARLPFSFTVEHPMRPDSHVARVYVLADANPVQLTAVFHFTPSSERVSVSTRIRLEKDSFVRVVALTSDGRFLMEKVYVRTPGGGCGGAVGSDEAKLREEAGRMKLQNAGDGRTNGVAFHIRHPMRTGFERTVMGYYAKAWYINRLDFRLNGEPLLGVDVGPGISADPYFRFGRVSALQGEVEVRAGDNEGKSYRNQWSF